LYEDKQIKRHFSDISPFDYMLVV